MPGEMLRCAQHDMRYSVPFALVPRPSLFEELTDKGDHEGRPYDPSD